MARLDDMRIIEEWEDHWLDPDYDFSLYHDDEEEEDEYDWLDELEEDTDE